MKYYVLLFFTLTSLLGPNPALARAPRCESIFLPNAREVLQNLDSVNYILNGKDLDTFISPYSFLRQRKIRALLDKTEIQKLSSPEAVERYSIELGTALFGSRKFADRWILKNKEQRLEESAVLLLKEEILLNGLQESWSRMHDPQSRKILARFVDLMYYLQSTRVAYILRMPFLLPPIKDRTIPVDLLFDVARDGYKNHEQRILVEFKTQNKVEAYNTFRRLYAPVLFAMMFIVTATDAYDEIERAQDAEVASTLKDLRSTQASLAEQIPRFKEATYKAAYEASLEQFRQKWGENPTAAEALELQTKLKIALKIRN